MENDVLAPVDGLDLSGLPEHLHEWARNLEERANRCQRESDAMARIARVLKIKHQAKAVLGDEK